MSSHVILCGSHRQHPRHSAAAGQPASDEIIEITLVLKRREAAPEIASAETFLSHTELAQLHGADLADIDAVEKFASEHHFSIVRTDAAARSVTISGRCSAMAAAFGADLELRRLGENVFRSRQGHLYVPESLAGSVVAVLGFDQRPVAGTYYRFHARDAQPAYYTPRQLAQIYNFPQNTGQNQTIALIELGGGFNNSDLQNYWKQLGSSNVSTTAVSVDGAQNSPTGDPNGPDGEVVLDIEVAGGVAPDARIVVYFAPNTDQGFLDAINAAIHDTVRNPSVISISWGSPESEWIPQAMNAFNAAFHDAALLGISVCAAAGDNGSSDGEQDGRNHVDFPASSPWVLACGGTRLQASGGKIQSETVWNDGTNGGATGGGISAHFSRPGYQSGLKISGCGVPDVAAVADPETGYLVFVDGEQGIVGGTSAVAPLWAGLIALCNEQLGKRLGWFHPALYSTLTRHKALHDITSGTNGAFKAGPGWDACTGLGSPDGQAILELLKQSSKK
jgi:kumamolisin